MTGWYGSEDVYAVGKLCLQNEDIAKNSLVLMSRELQYSTQAVIRNNIVVVLCDLAVR